MMALKNRLSQSTRLSPFFMMDGFHQFIMDFAVSPEKGFSLSPAEKGRVLVNKWRNSNYLAKAPMAITQELKNITQLHGV